MVTVIIMVGLPGSGKTTWSHEYASEHGFAVHSSDKVRERLFGDESILGDPRVVFDTLYSDIEADIISGTSVILDSTALLPRHREIVQRYRSMGCHTVAAVMTTSYDECQRRNLARERVVPEYAMRKMANDFTEPDISEGFDEIWHI